MRQRTYHPPQSHSPAISPDSPLALYVAHRQGGLIRRTSYGALALSAILLISLLLGIPSKFAASLSTKPTNNGVHFGPPAESLRSALERVISQKRSEFLRINSLIRVDGTTLKVREEYLLAAFGNEIKHGFFRTWLPREPMPGPNGEIRLGPSLSYQVQSARRWWLPPELLEKWEPLMDSNELLPIPPSISYPPKGLDSNGWTALKLGDEAQPLEHGVYLYRIDYEVLGAILSEEQSASAGFVFSVLQSLDTPVRTLDAYVQLADPPKTLRLFPIVTEEQTNEGKVSAVYRTDVQSPPLLNATTTISALTPSLGLQVIVGWTRNQQEHS